MNNLSETVLSEEVPGVFNLVVICAPRDTVNEECGEKSDDNDPQPATFKNPQHNVEPTK